MAAKKKAASEKASSKAGIKGAVRFGGRVYKAGEEDELNEALAAANVKEHRAYGVGSTEPKGKLSARDLSRQEELAARVDQAQAEASDVEDTDEEE